MSRHTLKDNKGGDKPAGDSQAAESKQEYTPLIPRWAIMLINALLLLVLLLIILVTLVPLSGSVKALFLITISGGAGSPDAFYELFGATNACEINAKEKLVCDTPYFGSPDEAKWGPLGGAAGSKMAPGVTVFLVFVFLANAWTLWRLLAAPLMKKQDAEATEIYLRSRINRGLMLLSSLLLVGAIALIAWVVQTPHGKSGNVFVGKGGGSHCILVAALAQVAVLSAVCWYWYRNRPVPADAEKGKDAQ